MNLPKTAIIGATGYIGRELFLLHRKLHPDCIGTYRNQEKEDLKHLDLLDCNIAPLNLAQTGYKDAIITAGVSKLYVCEQEKEYSTQITKGTLKLIEQLAKEGIKPIYISSDAVFDGHTGKYSDDARTNPLNEYGKQKDEIEKAIRKICGNNYLIARIGKVFTLEKGDGGIFDEMASILISGGKIKAAHDQIFSPTLLSDFLKAMSLLQAKKITGTFNISSPEVWSRYDLALEVAKSLRISPARVERVSLDDLQEIIVRPKNTSMNVQKFLKETGYKFTPISECIKKIAKKWILTKG